MSAKSTFVVIALLVLSGCEQGAGPVGNYSAPVSKMTRSEPPAAGSRDVPDQKADRAGESAGIAGDTPAAGRSKEELQRAIEDYGSEIEAIFKNLGPAGKAPEPGTDKPPAALLTGTPSPMKETDQ